MRDVVPLEDVPDPSDLELKVELFRALLGAVRVELQMIVRRGGGTTVTPHLIELLRYYEEER